MESSKMMSTYAHPTEIEALVQGLDPVDWVQMQLTASLPPGQRILAGLQAQAFAMASLRGPLLDKILKV